MPIILFFLFRFNSHGCETIYREPCLLNHLQTHAMTRKEDEQGPCANFKTLNTDWFTQAWKEIIDELKQYISLKNPYNDFSNATKRKKNYK